MKKSAFTLIEMLAVMAILAILVTLGSKGLRAARIGAKKAQAMVEMKSIETAVKAYQNKYGKLPVAGLVVQGQDDLLFSVSAYEDAAADSMEIISVLTAADDMAAGDNPAKMVYLEPQSDGADGRFLDPWGSQYLIALDSDYDGTLQVIGETIRCKVAVASVGLYLLNGSSSTNDLVVSWR